MTDKPMTEYEKMIERRARAIAREHWSPGMSILGWEPRTADEYADSEWDKMTPLARATFAADDAVGLAIVPVKATVEMKAGGWRAGASSSGINAAIAAGSIKVKP